ncbi:MAG TPA: hypothetical protein VMH27_08930 [Puia sp.]|nr:hypothetical protein [Puia sp.]
MRRILFAAGILILLNGCKKSQSGTAPITIPKLPPAQTAVGVPTGTPVTKTIGPAGGTVLSADGRVELDFPANALTTNTDITIQPATNTAPNGSGLAYHFMPDGSKFGVPVTLIFHYTATDANGTDPSLFYIAYQDSVGVWQADFKNRALDTSAKTASLSIGHFSFWALGSQLYLFAAPPSVTPRQVADLGMVILTDQGDLTPNGSGEFGMSALPSAIPIPPGSVDKWSVNGVPGGNSQDGTLSGSESTETFTAPSTIDKERTVQVSGAVSTDVKGWNKGKQVLQTNKFIAFTGILLEPGKLSFSVFVTLQWDNTSDLIGDVYWDSARFQVDVEDGKVTVGNYQNYPPNEVPSSGTVGNIKATWTSDGIGLTNVVGALAILGNGDTVAISLAHEGTDLPYWTLINLLDGTSSSFGGDEVPGYPSGVIFVAKDEPQAGLYNNGQNGTGGPITTTWSATPIH